MVRRVKEEYVRRGGWVRIFPTAESWDLYRYTYIQVYLHTGILTYRYTYIQVYLHTGILTYRYTYIQVYLHTGILTHRYTYIQVYLHVHIASLTLPITMCTTYVVNIK